VAVADIAAMAVAALTQPEKHANKVSSDFSQVPQLGFF